MPQTHSVGAVKAKAKRGVTRGKGLGSKPRRKPTGISTYRRLAAVFRRRISSGEWQAGDRLPALDALVKELRVGRITVRHALDLLADEGLIARHRDRRGSSVICQPLDRRWFTLALNLNELERHSAAITVSELESGPWHRPLPVAAKHGHVGAGYHRVVHLHHHKDYPHPVALTDLLIDRRLYRELQKETASDRPMLERLAAHHADLSQIEQTFTIGEADVEIARRLRLHESSPIAELRRIARDSHGTIIYFGYLFFPGQLVRLDFKVDLKAGNSGGP